MNILDLSNFLSKIGLMKLKENVLKIILYLASALCTCVCMCVCVCVCMYTYPYWFMGRVFTNGLGDWGSIPGQVIQKKKKKKEEKKKNDTWYLFA